MQTDPAAAPLRIDFVSDITCPWCAIGLQALEEALARIAATRAVELQLHPFELNPDIPGEGEPIAHYAARKYGVGADALAARQVMIRQRGAEAGLALAERTHVYNTFDAHRLLHWAGLQDRALALKHALLDAYHARRQNPARPEVLLKAARSAGLDPEAARSVLESGAYADVVRTRVNRWRARGVDSVPTLVVDGRYQISGAQSAEGYEQALRQFC